jgi:hypothetical protein
LVEGLKSLGYNKLEEAKPLESKLKELSMIDLEIRELRATIKLTEEEKKELDILIDEEEVKSIEDAEKQLIEVTKKLEEQP